MTHTQFSIQHPQLGTVIVKPHSTATRLIARWRNGIVHLTVPRSMRQRDILSALNAMAPRIVARRPEVQSEAAYHIGQTIELPGLTIIIAAQSHAPGRILARPALPVTTLAVGSLIDPSSASGTTAITRILWRIALGVAPQLLIPRAHQLAQACGIAPLDWRIGSGHRTLGTCSSARIITLSYMLVFLPGHLRDYIICHELAHLTEMNHSPRFHALCDRYCQGREKELIRQLRTYTWPVPRRT